MQEEIQTQILHTSYDAGVSDFFHHLKINVELTLVLRSLNLLVRRHLVVAGHLRRSPMFHCMVVLVHLDPKYNLQST